MKRIKIAAAIAALAVTPVIMSAESAAAATSSLSCSVPSTNIRATGTAGSNTWTAPGMFYNTVKLTASVADSSSTINMRVQSLTVTTYAGQSYTIYPASTGYNSGSHTFAGPGAVVRKVAMVVKIYHNGTVGTASCANYA